MKKEQIDILVSDGEMLPGDGILKTKNDLYMAMSKEVKSLLNKILEWYIQNHVYGNGMITGTAERFKKRVLSTMKDFLKTNNQKVKFLEEKIQCEILRMQYLRTDFPWEQTVEDIKECAFLHMYDDTLEPLIETLKFQLFEGKKIRSSNFPFISISDKFKLLDEYFYTQEMEEVYQAAEIDENIKFLQEKIKELSHPKNNSLIKLKTFDELFIKPYNSPEFIKSCVDVLRDVDPPLITKNNAVERCFKTGFIIWIEKLKGWAVASVNDNDYAELLNSKFPGLNFKDGQMFRKVNRSSEKYKEYNTAISILISQVKASL